MQKIHELQRRSPHIFALLLASAFLALAYTVVAMLLLIPGAAHATVCGTGSNVPFTDIGGGNCRAYITASQSITPPSDWNPNNNTIDCIGGGGGGARGGGGGGGGFARATNASWGVSTAATIGGGGAGNFGSTGGTGNPPTSFGSICAATGGTGGMDGTAGGAGGTGGSGTIGGTRYSGGNGYPSYNAAPWYGGGGGGAAGFHGNGGNASGSTGGTGDAGFGGAGGAAYSGSGVNGTEYSASFGSGGGGGGGAGSCWSPGCAAGSAGFAGYYGGGGGGGGQGYTTDGQPSNGLPGLIVITYSPIPPPGTSGIPTYSSITSTGMTVNWSAATGATSYKVERCSGANCTPAQITSGVVGTSYADSGLTAGTSYTYRVRGTNGAGDGAYSATSTQVTLPGTPGTPTFSGVTGNSMTVSWTASSGATSYKIERCTGTSCTPTQIASGVTATSYLDSGLSASTVYTYRIRATDAGGDSGYSGMASQTTTSGATGSGIGSGIPITGWLWSDNFGWISTNCSNTNSCGTVNYGMAIDPSSGELSGDGWSDNIGWVSANAVDLTGCPTAPCTATISGGNLTGWFKVIAGGSGQSGGWDGFISLNGAGYGVAFSGGSFSGYAWDASGATMNNVKEMDGTIANGVQVAGEGWISFAGASSTYGTCSAGTVYSCTNPDSSGIYRTIVQTVTNGSCAQTVTNTSCTAPQFCTPGVSTCVTPPPTDSPTGSLTGHLTAKPNLVPYNATTTIYWGLVNVNSCTVTANDGTSWTGTFSATSSCPTKYNGGCQTLPITQQTTFTLTCTDFNSQPYKETATVNVLPQFQEQ